MNIELTEKECIVLIKILLSNFADLGKDIYEDRCFVEKLMWKLGKLIKFCFDDDLVRKQNYEESSKRLTFGKLFCGAGYHSQIACNQIHQRLNYAISTLSGAQQNGGMGSDFDEEEDKQSREDIKNVMKDLLIAFNISPEELIESKLEFDI